MTEEFYTIIFENGARWTLPASSEKEAVKIAYEEMEKITAIPKNKLVRVSEVLKGSVLENDKRTN